MSMLDKIDFSQRKTRIIAVAIFCSFCLLLVLLMSLGDTFFNKEETAAEYVSPDAPAIITGRSSELYGALEGQIRFEQVREDLAIVGKENISSYKAYEELVKFFVNSVETSDSTVTATGYFEVEPKNNLQIKAQLLSNERLSLVVDYGGKVYTEELQSNSDRNKFIATLPYDELDYTIDFDSDTNSFLMKLYDLDAGESASNFLQQKLGISSLSQENTQIIPLVSDINRFQIAD